MSDKLSQLDVSDQKDLSHDDNDSKPDVTSADGQAEQSAENKKDKFLGIDASCYTQIYLLTLLMLYSR